jgi:hypothetical protein
LLIIRALLHPGSFHGLNKKAPRDRWVPPRHTSFLLA